MKYLKLNYPGGLHNHSQYSNLRLRDSINRENEMIDYAIELGHEVIAFTEHETISNAIKIEKYYKKIREKHPDFKIILGNEIYLCRDDLNGQNFEKGFDKYFHFILLAKDAEGHKQIRELSTRAWMRSYNAGKMTRVPTYYRDLVEIIAANPGHVIGCTACLGGFLGTKLLQWQSSNFDFDFYLKIKGWLINIQKIFGVDNFYLEMQPSPNEEQIFVNKEIIKLSKELNIPYIITTDSHYLKKEDAEIHKAFLNAQDGDREVDSFYQTTYIMGTEELESYMNDYFDDEIFNKAYTNILKIKASCEDYSLLKPLKIPSIHKEIVDNPLVFFVEGYEDKMPYLKKFAESDYYDDRLMAFKIIEKISSDPRLDTEESWRELEENLKITWISSEVNKTHWSSYFLNLRHILKTCWNAGTLVGPGRGSGVGFYLLYLLDIIQINPLWETTKTFSWRLTLRFKGLLCSVTSSK